MRGNRNLVGGGHCREIFSGGGDEEKFGSCGDSHFLLVGGWGSCPSRENPDLYISLI